MDAELAQFLNERLMMLIVLVAFALVDVVGGALIAWKNGEFKWECVPEFLKTFFVYAWAWISAELIGFLPTLLNVNVEGFAQVIVGYSGSAVYAFVVLKYVASILTHIQNSNALPLKVENTLRKVGVPPTTPEG